MKKNLKLTQLFYANPEELAAWTELDDFRLAVEFVGVNDCLTYHADHVGFSIFIRGHQQTSVWRQVKSGDVVIALNCERL
jgi:hypothetical protein